MGHPWPGAANPASMPGCPLRNTCARPATSRNVCRPYVLRRSSESKAGYEPGRSHVGEICKADLLLLFLPRFHRRRKMRVGRVSAGVVGWVARHGCRASAAGPWMARRRVPTPRHRSERTAAKRGPDASAEVLVTFGTCTDRAHRLHVYGDMVNTFWRTHFAGKPSCLGIREMP
ncbi:Uncharacterised protein [Paucimonas lemoignei]|nr:Uncharacterised protein [Paucimonas lemoignei]